MANNPANVEARRRNAIWAGRPFLPKRIRSPGNRISSIHTIGSGTLVCSPEGRTIVLTARHVVCEEPSWKEMPYGMGYHLCEGGLDNVIADVVEHPSPSMDVAVVILTDVAASRVAQLAVASDIVAEAPDRDGPWWWIVGGYPFKHVHPRVSPGTGQVNAPVLWPILYGVGNVRNDNRGQYVINWTEGKPTEVTAEHFRDLGVVARKTKRLCAPNGISGGALWRYGGVKKGELWAAERVGTLQGVPTSWIPEERIQFAEAATAWGDWFRTAVEEIDRRWRGAFHVSRHEARTSLPASAPSLLGCCAA